LKQKSYPVNLELLSITWPLICPNHKTREIKVARGHRLKATPVFDTYWRFAQKRQQLFIRRVTGAPPPWTADSVLAAHRFTNVYRASDRVSQYLIRHVLYRGRQTGEEIFFRALLFKLFNQIETWETLTSKIGPLAWKTFDFEQYAGVLDAMMAYNQKVYSAA
jgi:5-hmdU DNA kinase-like protein